MRSVSEIMRCQKEQIRPQFLKYWFQNESAASHIFGDFRAREPNLHSKIGDFDFLSVSLDFFCMKSHCKPKI